MLLLKMIHYTNAAIKYLLNADIVYDFRNVKNQIQMVLILHIFSSLNHENTHCFKSLKIFLQ
jgi:hypothetical protein